eukprot:TRINITY_DN3004_c0_g3_i1.p1 TRINITY_DN3004_c0_g3~~TRINITY_DN3004_c0_g3_i1.p1  ORF type:complete len:1085 (+),score=308.86 TRINITY_DN3004_c0_g3_i1:67-3321(+)
MAAAQALGAAPAGGARPLLELDAHNEEEYGRVFCQYFEYLALEQFEELMLQGDERQVYPVHVDVVMLLNHNAKVGHILLVHPTAMIPVAQASAVRTQEALLRKINVMKAAADATPAPTPASAVSADDCAYTVKRNVKVRLQNLPLTDDFYKKSIASLGTEDVGQLLCVKGIVIREGSVKMFEAVKEYACDRCNSERRQIDALSPVHGAGVVQRPLKCDGCSRAMTLVPTLQSHSACKLRDYQEIKLQDIVTNLEAGTIPRSITVVLEDDLAESCRAGDDLVVVGVLTQRWNREPKAEQRSVIELVLAANHIRVTNENKAASFIAEEEEEAFNEFWAACPTEAERLRARNALVRSVCPQVFGLHRVKLGMLLVLIGGYSIDGETEGNRTRGECHMLLVGDPGTAKSQFLHFASCMASRSVCTTGIGSTAAGLTVSAYKESGEWVLDAGALVIADGGVCCIDEFSTIPEQKHIAIHEAMEQQTISIAKAGLVTTLNTRCSIVAACNPKKDQSLHDGETSIGIATPLLSRFDLIMVMLDNHNSDWDSRLARFVLERAEQTPYDPDDARPRTAGAPAPPPPSAASQPHGRRQITVDMLRDAPHWESDTLRTYVEWVRAKKRSPPLPMTPAASAVIQRYYNLAREQRSSMNKARRTVRMLESLIRLSQAHALLVCREEVALEDAVVAVALHDLTNEQAYADTPKGGDAPLRAVAPEDPYADYLETQEKLLMKLGLAADPLFDGVPRWAPPEGVESAGLTADARYAYVPSQTQDAPNSDDPMAALFASRGRRTTATDAGGAWRTPAPRAPPGDSPVGPATRGAKRPPPDPVCAASAKRVCRGDVPSQSRPQNQLAVTPPAAAARGLSAMRYFGAPQSQSQSQPTPQPVKQASASKLPHIPPPPAPLQSTPAPTATPVATPAATPVATPRTSVEAVPLGSGMLCVTPEVRDGTWCYGGVDDVSEKPWDELGVDLDLESGDGDDHGASAPSQPPATPAGALAPPSQPPAVEASPWAGADFDINAVHPTRVATPSYASQGSELSQPIVGLTASVNASMQSQPPPGRTPTLRKARLGNANRMARSINKMRTGRD